METKNDQRTVPNDEEFLSLLSKVKENDPDSILELIDLFKGDIAHVSQFIHSSREDAVADIILEFLEMIREEDR
ncbi:hypothetical protein [Paenibacillus senegalimassiliensis]|uniref:hypothetical protein n=1 Tax=Paenibacillus senegalimassiliensis TaxID=1737426 RepID=UPI00073EFD51|nr:hypothetical protein [Paenibacillus senegalimassiliensis]